MKLTILLLPLVCGLAAGFACTADYCTKVDCSDAPVCASHCASNQVYKPKGGTCGCCAKCVTQLEEGESCLQLAGGDAPNSECKSPYTCKDGKCK